ncbi:kinase-like protein, partial [Exidia glandulosa HHB12029]
QRLRREIYIWKRLVHPNVHQLCGLYETLGPLPALVSEWHERGDIKQYLDTWTRLLTPVQILDVAQGLEYCESILHGREIVHGDIKGANVLISNDGVARLSDFGFSVLLANYSQSLTQTSNIHGTYRWMAPELVLEEGARHSYASDIWAFGCLIIEVYSGQVPYHTRRNHLQVVTALARSEPPPLPSALPAFLMAIVLECCTFVVEERPAASYIVACIPPKAVLSRISFMVR